MTPEYVEAHGGEAMRRMGISDWIAEEVLLLCADSNVTTR